ncbi:receptor-like protein kinase [Carex littledalei]|uniref:Receptor-like protein kinase n=1 Tax=Carex littledalei TaxID=544730 RepID=A0A833QWC0_9POAL|nr:receptor-like protein kinase [Carex littledalei]
MNAIMDQPPIGEGTTATVYHGVLGGRDAAIKCIRSEYAQQFEDELTIISRFNHQNIVRLLGNCFEKEDRFIVYEFMRGGSLDALKSRRSTSLGSDIFSFGSILLDLVMGRDLLPKIMEPMITSDYVSRIMDPSFIADQVPLEEVTEVVELVSRCRMEARETRPLLEEVIDCLKAIKDR